jgi:alanyl-tRNA synthetase
LDYFKKNDHRIVPSSPVIPFNDPTLLFTNAGMNQFKDVFTGQRNVDYKRVASVQKCIRAGGKHNDLDNVGFTTRHHTFFEMLGNFSFGDYFKEQAIYYAWEWLTKELKLPIDRLYATVYEDDDEAFTFWEKVASPLKEKGRILRFGRKDNYWAMGDTGPCGPCSEVHFDRGEKFGTGLNDVVNGETERFVEIWNLVFMQYERRQDGQVVDLPKLSVDTGAGLERLTSVIQNVDSVFQIDIFKNIIAAISDITKKKYKETGDTGASHHIIADHVRALTFAIADGAGISNEGQGYVLRRILRRAARHGRLLDMHEPFIYRLVPILVNEMSDAYPEIKEKQNHIEKVIKGEEEAFSRTLDTGCELFGNIAKKVKSTGGTVIDGEDVFRLYDTYGFPYDLTEIMAAERGLSVDIDGFNKLLDAQREQSRISITFGMPIEWGTKVKATGAMPVEWTSDSATEFVRDSLSINTKLLGMLTATEMGWKDDSVAILLAETPFYAAAGGQVSDTGKISGKEFVVKIHDIISHREKLIHRGKVVQGSQKQLIKGATVTAEVDADRRWDIMRNHTATHLTHAALRKVLGSHIKQSGSYVGPDRLRFDFSHHQPMTPEEIQAVEEMVNEQILKGSKVDIKEDVPVEEAMASDAMALFGEKYSDKVRVVSVPGFSKELCGGTHIDNTSQIGPFFITLETGIASGVRRLEAITGREAIKYMLSAKQFRQEAASIIGRTEAEALEGMQQLRDNNVALQKEIKKIKTEMFSGTRRPLGKETRVGQVTVVTFEFEEGDKDVMAGWVDAQKDRREPVVALSLGIINGKPTFMTAASGSAVSQFHIDVGELSQQLLPQFGGRGGGKPSFAQGTVAQGTKPLELFEAARLIIKKEVEKSHGKGASL